MVKDSNGSGHCHSRWWRRPGEVGLLTLPPYPIVMARSLMPKTVAYSRGPSTHQRDDLSKGPPNWHPIGLGANGELRGTSIPNF